MAIAEPSCCRSQRTSFLPSTPTTRARQFCTSTSTGASPNAPDDADVRDVQPQQPAGLDAPNLKVTIPETDGASWRSWFNKFVVDGNNGTENEKNGQLDLVSRSGKTLATLKLQNLGIFRLTPRRRMATMRRLPA